jgi:hypothetical protein
VTSLSGLEGSTYKDGDHMPIILSDYEGEEKCLWDVPDHFGFPEEVNELVHLSG